MCLREHWRARTGLSWGDAVAAAPPAARAKTRDGAFVSRLRPKENEGSSRRAPPQGGRNRHRPKESGAIKSEKWRRPAGGRRNGAAPSGARSLPRGQGRTLKRPTELAPGASPARDAQRGRRGSWHHVPQPAGRCVTPPAPAADAGDHR